MNKRLKIYSIAFAILLLAGIFGQFVALPHMLSVYQSYEDYGLQEGRRAGLQEGFMYGMYNGYMWGLMEGRASCP